MWHACGFILSIIPFLLRSDAFSGCSQGAMYCWSQESCDLRNTTDPYYMSSTSWTPEMAQGGIFATDGTSPWGTANRCVRLWCGPLSVSR